MAAITLNARLPQSLASCLITAFLFSPIAMVVSVATQSAAAGLAAAAFGAAAWNWPVEILALLVATAPIMRSWNSAVVSPVLIGQIKTAAVLLLGAVWLCKQMALRRSSGFPQWLSAYLACWAGLTVLALINTVHWDGSLVYLGNVFAGLMIFAISFQLEAQAQRRLLGLILTVGGVLGLLVLLQYGIVVYHIDTFLARFIVEPRTRSYFSAGWLLGSARIYRPSGTMSHPNEMGLYLAMLIPFAVALLRVHAVKAWVRWLLVAGISSMTLGLWATGSRAAALFLLVALVYLGLHAGYRWILAGFLGLVVLTGALFRLSPSPATLQDVLTSARIRTGLSGRNLFWKNTFNLVREAPLFGFGPGNFSREYVAHFGFFVPNNAAEQSMQIRAIQTTGERAGVNFHAHNIYLQLAGELGWGGPLLFIAGLWGVLRHSERRSRHGPRRSFRRALALATAASAVGLAAYGFFDSQLAFTVGSLNHVAGALLAMGLIPGGCYAEQKSTSYKGSIDETVVS